MIGILLANVGTPASTGVADVRRYLGEFLMDPRVISIPTLLRWLLVHGIILRTRPKKSAAAYRAIWTERGSPLLSHTEDLAAGLRRELGGGYVVEIGMRYQQPSLANALDRLAAAVDEVIVVPLFPQYSAAAWASVFDAVAAWSRRRAALPALHFLPPFHAHPAFLDAAAAVARPHLRGFGADKVLMSFHGLPVRHVRACDRSGAHCLVAADCCASLQHQNAFCYRAQCFATANSLAGRLDLAQQDYEVTFQSRLTRNWIEPFTDVRLPQLVREGVRRLAVLCPAFVADCLETLEEIGIRARADFRAAGGEDLLLVPCVDADPVWVRGLATILFEFAPRAAAGVAH
ncbi:MAG TPA: ferrochelatase [Planctomycetota bacterium]|nr:ferrochelatase [Planctomycetota bacterium]